MKSILGKKIGMTQVFDEHGVIIPVTVVEAGPMVVTQIKTVENDGYNAIQVGYIDRKEKHLSKALKGHFEKAQTPFKKVLREILVESTEGYELGQEITLNIFTDKDIVDVVGTSKGKGTQGSIKRHNFSRGPESHGSKSHRTAGARSAATYPGRVWKGKKGSGKMGNERVTVQNLEIVKVDENRGVILIKGALPGAKGSLVTIRTAIKSK